MLPYLAYLLIEKEELIFTQILTDPGSEMQAKDATAKMLGGRGVTFEVFLYVKTP